MQEYALEADNCEKIHGGSGVVHAGEEKSNIEELVVASDSGKKLASAGITSRWRRR